MKTSASAIHRKLKSLANPIYAEKAKRFTKTGPGEYGEGDRFLGLRVPVLRGLVKEYEQTPLSEIEKVLTSPFQDERLFALLLLVAQFKAGDETIRDAIYSFYLAHTKSINNWALVDSSAYHIVGPYLETRSRKPLYKLARSKSLWERRMAIIATLHFIRQKDFEETLALSKILLNDPEDLIHKAVGWMLREVGNRDRQAEKNFLDQHASAMPRTMLRYALEKFPAHERKHYLAS